MPNEIKTSRIKYWQERTAIPPFEETWLQSLSQSERARLLRRLKEKYLEQFPQHLPSLRPEGVYIEHLHSWAGIPDGPDWGGAPREAQHTHILAVEQTLWDRVIPTLPPFDILKALPAYLDPETAPGGKPISPGQHGRLRNDLALAGIRVDRDMHERLSGLTMDAASQLIQQIVNHQPLAEMPWKDSPARWVPLSPYPTRELIERGAPFRKHIIAAWGVPWPKPTAWRRRLEFVADMVHR